MIPIPSRITDALCLTALTLTRLPLTSLPPLPFATAGPVESVFPGATLLQYSGSYVNASLCFCN